MAVKKTNFHSIYLTNGCQENMPPSATWCTIKKISWTDRNKWSNIENISHIILVLRCFYRQASAEIFVSFFFVLDIISQRLLQMIRLATKCVSFLWYAQDTFSKYIAETILLNTFQMLFRHYPHFPARFFAVKGCSRGHYEPFALLEGSESSILSSRFTKLLSEEFSLKLNR